MKPTGLAPHPRAWLRRAWAARQLAVLVSGVALLTACGSNDQAEPTPGTTTTRRIAAVPAPDPRTPEGVAVAALQEIFTWLPANEAPGASLQRAQELLGPSLLRVIQAPTSEMVQPPESLQWADWSRSGVRIEAFAFASRDRGPTDSAVNTAQFKIGIEQAMVYPDGRRTPLRDTTVIATVVRTPDGWRLDAYR